MIWFQGMDLMKHGESAYPAKAWVEQQYMEDGHRLSNGLAIIAEEVIKMGLPPNMSFSRQVSFSETNKNGGICNPIMDEDIMKYMEEEKDIKKEMEEEDDTNEVFMNDFTES